MIYFLLIFLLASFAQTTFLPINIALILIIMRNLVVDDKRNYIIAFFAGVILGLLANQNMGIWALIFLIVTKLIFLIKKLPVSARWIFIVPLTAVIVLSVSFIEQLLFKQNLNISKVISETLLAVPVYVVMLFIEERFNANSDIKLRLSK